MSETYELAGKLRSEGEKFYTFFEGLTDNQWTIEVYTEGAVWSIRSILAHLMTTERAFISLFTEILDGGVGVTEDFIIDRYNASQQRKTKEMGRKELLGQYKLMREEMIKFVFNLTDTDLEKIGRHPYLGMTTLREMIKMIYIHNQIHFRDIKKVLITEHE
jgi:uncharacterized damage-inducible protein DinB